MKGFSILVLLSSVVLLCSTAPALEPVTCSSESTAAAARLAMHRINQHHTHGYKFRLFAILTNKTEKTDTGCDMELQLQLSETICHVLSPKHFEDCDYSRETDGAVGANCTVMMSVENDDAKVKSYLCDTHRGLTASELIMICPDCPRIIPLNSESSLKAAQAAVTQFNQNTSNQHYFVLQEVGRTKTGYIPGMGMQYYSEIALVESHCPMSSRIVPQACDPLCPDRAQHAVCKSSYSRMHGTVNNLRCDFFPALNATSLGPGEQEPICEHLDHLGPPGPPGPPGANPRPGDVGPPPRPFPHKHQCHADPDLEFHPICPWP